MNICHTDFSQQIHLVKFELEAALMNEFIIPNETARQVFWGQDKKETW